MPVPESPQPSRLGASARAALLWGGGFTLLRDVAQFGVMLVLVRLLSPSDYGIAAIAQTIIGVASIMSYATFSLHALQVRDPSTIDWQMHFTAATLINAAVCCLVWLAAWALTFLPKYSDAALPLAALGVVFLVEIPGALRLRMVEANHDWKRFRSLLAIGILLGLGSGLAVALMGGGVWALIVQPPLGGLPAAFDLFVLQRFRPDFPWRWDRWRGAARFGLHRLGSGLFGRARALNENMLLSSVYDLATLGIFTRANGLATLLAGRVGTAAMTAIYPVVTRADRGSARFRRLASLVLRGVCWMTVPGVGIMAVSAHDIVLLLYGPKWAAVAPLVPLAGAVSGIIGVWNALSSLLVANDNSRAVLWIDGPAALSAIGLAFLLVPQGIKAYLVGLALYGSVAAAVTIVVLLRQRAMSAGGIATAIGPAVLAGLAGTAVALGLRASGGEHLALVLRILLEAAGFGFAYVATLRIGFANQLLELLEVLPGGLTVARAMLLPLRPELAT